MASDYLSALFTTPSGIGGALRLWAVAVVAGCGSPTQTAAPPTAALTVALPDALVSERVDSVKTPTESVTAPSGALQLSEQGIAGTPERATLEALRRAFPEFEVYNDEIVFDNSPNTKVSVPCVGRARKCHARFYAQADGTLQKVEILDPSVKGPQGVHVGIDIIELDLRGCGVMLGDERGLRCTLLDSRTLTVFLINDLLLYGSASSETPTKAQYEGAKVFRLVWSPSL